MKRLLSLSGSGLLALSAVLLTGGLAMSITPQTYESTARVALKPTASGGSTARPGESDLTRWQSAAVLHDVITNLDLSLKWGERFKLGALSLDMTEKFLRAQLTVKEIRGSVTEVRVQSEDPTEAAEIANALVDAYQRALAPGYPNAKTLEKPSPTGAIEKVLVFSDSPISILEKATPNLRPVRPHPLAKMLVPLTGLLAGMLGVLLLWIRVMK